MKTSEEFAAWLRERLMSRDREFSLVAAIAERDREHERTREELARTTRIQSEALDVDAERLKKVGDELENVRRQYVSALETAALRFEAAEAERDALRARVAEIVAELAAVRQQAEALRRIKGRGRP